MSNTNRVARLLGVLVILWGAMAHADQQLETASDGKSSNVANPEVNSRQSEIAKNDVLSRAGGRTEGVKVHGHWIIEVRESDGTLVHRREFENALTSNTGPAFLSGLLGRINVVGRWAVLFSATPSVCSGSIGCYMAEANDPRTDAHVFKTLNLTRLPGTATPPWSLQLSGTMTADADGGINFVNTYNYRCETANIPVTADCVVAPIGPTASIESMITRTQLSPEISVLAGQQVQVTVILSFS